MCVRSQEVYLHTKSHCHLSLEGASACFSVCALAPLSSAWREVEDGVISVVLAEYLRLSVWTLASSGWGRCVSLDYLSPPPSAQSCLGDKHKCHVFCISAVNIMVWITFNSDCVSSWERIPFTCWHVKMKVRRGLTFRSVTRKASLSQHCHPCLPTFSDFPGSEIMAFPPPISRPTCTSFWCLLFVGEKVH